MPVVAVLTATAAALIHLSFFALESMLGASISAARVWGDSARIEGQPVGRDHMVADNDIVEILT